MNETRLYTFVGRVVEDLGAAMSGVMVNVGYRLGLYRAMAGAGPLTAASLAAQTGTRERYVREWLNNQAAGGYVTYQPETDSYELPEEQAMVLGNQDSPVFMAGGFETVGAVWMGEDKLVNAFRTGQGIGWHEHHHRLFSGTEAFFRTGYKANLATQWIPALDGVAEKLGSGGVVADVGCGHGASTIVMAQAFPNSTFFGFDYHPESIRVARERAAEAGVGDRVRFEVASAKGYPANDYDLVCFMDCLHDMGDPLGAARHARGTLSSSGTVLLVEPFAGDRVEQNLTPTGRLFYAASTAVCTPASLSQEVGAGLGAQAGEQRLAAILTEAGFSRVRRATETPFNLILEARP
jgi:SAM-dependent methyltransferase